MESVLKLLSMQSSTAMTERLNQAVTDGKLTPEEAAEKAAGIPDRATEIVNTVPERKDKDHGPKRGAFIGEILLEVGLDADVVKEGFANGQTLGETAEANGISSETIVNAIVDCNDRTTQSSSNRWKAHPGGSRRESSRHSRQSY